MTIDWWYLGPQEAFHVNEPILRAESTQLDKYSFCEHEDIHVSDVATAINDTNGCCTFSVKCQLYSELNIKKGLTYAGGRGMAFDTQTRISAIPL